jgi:serine/threonine protein kinase
MGYLKGFAEQYELGKRLGKGGSGTVHACTRRATGAAFAVKSIPKVLVDPGVSDRKRAAQMPSIRSEVEVLLALRGSLSVAAVEAVHEDAGSVHIVMELCRGGEVLGRAGHGRRVAHSERGVASLLRAVLQTVAQCHSRGVLHRDVKPENFLLATADASSPVKAIDFGLAVFFTPASLPLTAPNVRAHCKSGPTPFQFCSFLLDSRSFLVWFKNCVFSFLGGGHALVPGARGLPRPLVALHRRVGGGGDGRVYADGALPLHRPRLLRHAGPRAHPVSPGAVPLRLRLPRPPCSPLCRR